MNLHLMTMTSDFNIQITFNKRLSIPQIDCSYLLCPANSQQFCLSCLSQCLNKNHLHFRDNETPLIKPSNISFHPQRTMLYWLHAFYLTRSALWATGMFPYQNWCREPLIFTGIGTEYLNYGTVTTLIFVDWKIVLSCKFIFGSSQELCLISESISTESRWHQTAVMSSSEVRPVSFVNS